MRGKKTSVFSNGLIWFGAGVSIAEILTGTYLAPLGFGRGLAAILLGHVIGCALLFLYRKFLLNHELCKQIALQKQGTENRRLRLEDIKTFFSKIIIVDIIKFM